jgi:hypothetical protein
MVIRELLLDIHPRKNQGEAEAVASSCLEKIVVEVVNDVHFSILEWQACPPVASYAYHAPEPSIASQL